MYFLVLTHSVTLLSLDKKYQTRENLVNLANNILQNIDMRLIVKTLRLIKLGL